MRCDDCQYYVKLANASLFARYKIAAVAAPRVRGYKPRTRDQDIPPPEGGGLS